jgi:hypothetical protein
VSIIDHIAALQGIYAALDLLAGSAARDWPSAEVIVAEYCEAAQPRFNARGISRAEAIALLPTAACALACEPCGRGRHVIEIMCDGTDHNAIGRLRVIDPSAYPDIAARAS